MPLKSATVDALGIVTLALIVLISCVGVFCIIYVLKFRSNIKRRVGFYALRDFNSPWRVRIILVSFAILWCLAELLRLPLLRRKGWVFHAIRFQWQANLCRLYALLSLGFAEPCFFLTALFLVRGSLRESPSSSRRGWDSKVVALVLGFCFPVFGMQLFFVIITPLLEFHKHYEVYWEGYGKIPSYFTTTFHEIRSHKQQIAACTYPLFSSLVLALFAVIFLVCFSYLCWKMVLIVINRKLQVRIYSLVLVVLLLLPIHVIFLALSALSTPGEAVFEAMAFLGFLTILVCAGIGAWILVIGPISDALAVPWVSEDTGVWQRSCGFLQIENHPLPLPSHEMHNVRNNGEINLHENSSFQTEPKCLGKNLELSVFAGEKDDPEASGSNIHC